MRILLTGVGVVAALAAAPAPAGAQGGQAPPDCSAEAFHQFDFWIGDWQVSAGGARAGTNTIEAALDGCALTEHWTSASGVEGRSFNFYERATGRWHQAWTDARGGALWLTGGFVDGRMVMQSDPRPGPDDATVVHRLTWSPETGGRVRQLWETSRDGGRTWTVTFDGMYEPAR